MAAMLVTSGRRIRDCSDTAGATPLLRRWARQDEGAMGADKRRARGPASAQARRLVARDEEVGAAQVDVVRHIGGIDQGHYPGESAGQDEVLLIEHADAEQAYRPLRLPRPTTRGPCAAT